MVIIDDSRTHRRRDLLLRQSSSSSSVFLKAAANKTTKKAPQQLLRCDMASSRSTRRRDLLSRQYSSSSNKILRKDDDSKTANLPQQLRRSPRRIDLLSRQSFSSSSKISKPCGSQAVAAMQHLHLDTVIDRRPRRRDLLLRQSSSTSDSMFLRKAAAAKTPKPQRRDSSNSASRRTRRRDSSSTNRRTPRRRDLLLRQASICSTSTVETLRTLKMNKSKDGGIIGSEIICINIVGGEVQQPVSRSSRVSFSTEYESVFVARRTKAETAASFYSQEDLTRIEADTFGTILEMDLEKKYPSSETQYHRGLLTARAQYEKEQRIKFVVSQVIKEQERNKTLSEEWVKAFSKKYSSQTTAAAFYFGKIDAKAAGATDTLSTHSYLRSLQRPKAFRGQVNWI